MIFKTSIKYLFMVAALAIGFQSCSDDDDETPASQVVAGSYSGYSSASFQYSSSAMYYNGETVAIAANNDGTVNVTFSSVTWGTTTISNASVAQSGSNYTIAGSGSTSITGHGGSASTYECTLAGTISSDKKTYSLAFTMNFMGGTVVTFTNGEASAAHILQGSLSGTNTMVMTYMPNGIDYADQKTTITANEDGTINISAKFTSTDEAGTTTEMGNITLENVEVTESGDNYTFSVAEATYNMGMSGTLSPYACTVEGTISKDKKTFSIVYTLPAVMGGTTITFHN